MQALGTLEELPADYRAALTALNLVPLWPSLRNVLPPHAPNTATRATQWRWADIRPLLLQAGELTPMDKAERRVLVLANPGRGLENLQASSTIYLGMQLVLPGEVAPNHRHTPNAARVVVEGEGAYTVVDGHRCVMEHGDLVLTPTGLWHEHRHEGQGPFMWLDVLDLPLIHYLDVSYAIEGKPQTLKPAADPYSGGGLVPLAHGARSSAGYPLLRYPWQRARAALLAMAGGVPMGQAVHLNYVNPENGGDCLNTLAFTALMVRPGEEATLARISPSRVLHVIEGEGQIEVNGTAMACTRADTLCAPGRAAIRIANRSAKQPLFLLTADESPVHRKLGVFERFDD